MGDVLSHIDDDLSIELFKNASKTKIVDFSLVRCRRSASPMQLTVAPRHCLPFAVSFSVGLLVC